ncbi:hypothetical protein TNCV_3129171 [Trichonephila clavipes]|nr:hypothetical protein TNCV_3129171 [Trichonephila clavipes]
MSPVHADTFRAAKKPTSRLKVHVMILLFWKVDLTTYLPSEAVSQDYRDKLQEDVGDIRRIQICKAIHGRKRLGKRGTCVTPSDYGSSDEAYASTQIPSKDIQRILFHAGSSSQY